ncbi:MAG TPA: VIT domain-containing protein, partial [Armatimonadota bacterium]|nr:VIT domain-containing protein [Armatimonadota bacterium]
MRFVALFFGLVFALGALRAQPASPPIDADVTQGALRVRAADGAVVECPLTHTAVKGDISGFIARVQVTQTFVNTAADNIEAVYVFPLPNTAAVDGMTMVIGDRRVVGVIKQRADARRLYEEALSRGATASLLEQERPNIFTQSVGNIPPGQEVRIEITYLDVLRYDMGSYEFHFPMVVGPRYLPGGDRVPDAACITPPVLEPGQRNGHDISLSLTLEAGVPIHAIHTSSHRSNITPVRNTGAKVMLLPNDAIPNKDFILRYKVAGEQPQLAMLAHKPEGGDGYFMLMMQPSLDHALRTAPPREMVFLVDVSGSMSGAPTEKVKQTMREFF